MRDSARQPADGLQLLGLEPLLLEEMPFGDVRKESDQALDSVQFHRNGLDINRERCSVPAQASALDSLALPKCPFYSFQFLCRMNGPDIHREQFVPLIAEHPADDRIGIEKLAGSVENKARIGKELRSVVRTRLYEGKSIMDVPRN